MVEVTVDDVKRKRERIQLMTSDLAVLQDRQRQVQEQLEGVNANIKAIVGDEDPAVYLANLEAEAKKLNESIEKGLLKAEDMVAAMKEKGNG
jgi:hypothetical protein